MYITTHSNLAPRAQFKKVASFHGPNLRDARPDSTCLKWGIYRPDMKASEQSPHDRVRAAVSQGPDAPEGQ
jgi:hypothetical protein